jgi:hypothetical protein
MCSSKVVGQDLPGDTVDDQVMRNQQQAAGAT